MKTLAIAKDLRLPADVVTQTFLIVGKRGSGKSNTAARLVEQLHGARIPFVVLDPVDTWWGLKAGKDGGRGLDVYVFGGAKQDLPLEPGAGAMLAEVLCEHRVPMVLSVKHLSGRGRSAFMVAFAQTVFQKWQGGPLHVVLEEAHEFAPQMSGGRGGSNNNDNEAAMLGAFKRLWKLGRASGIGGTAITQRPASLSKDITTQSEILIAHRTIGPQDVEAIGKWVKYHGQLEETLADLPSLPTGQAFVWAPEFPSDKPLGLMRTTIYLRETYDSAATPKVGEKRIEPKELAPVDLERLRTKMAATIERAKADDPKELRKQLAEARAALAKVQKTGSAPADRTKTGENYSEIIPKVIEKKVVGPKEAAALERTAAKLEVLHGHLTGPWTEKVQQLGELVKGTLEAGQAHAAAILTTAKEIRQALAPAPVMPQTAGNMRGSAGSMSKPAHIMRAERQAPRPPREVKPPAEGLSKPQQRILDALAWGESVRLARLPKTQLAFLADASPTSSAFQNNLGTLRTAGYIDYPAGGFVALTDGGRAVGQRDSEYTPTTSEELQAVVYSKLSTPQANICRALVDAWPDALSKTDLAERAGASETSSAFQNNLGSLRSLGVIDYPQRGFVKAEPVLFLDEN